MAAKINVDLDLNIKSALKSIKSFAGSVKGGFDSAALGVTGLNQGFALASKGLAAFGKVYDKTVKQALEFQDSIAEINTLLDDQSVSTKKLGKVVLGLQKQFGGEAKVKAEAFYSAISSGAVDAAHAQEFLIDANKLAVGGVTDISVAVDGLTTIISAFGLEADDTKGINDALFVAMKKGKTTIGELSSGISVAAAGAAALGVEYTELLGATSALTTGGLSTNVAFTQIRATMTALSKPTKGLQVILDKLGISSIKAAVEQDGFVGVLQKVVKETDGSAESINQLFGSVEAVGAVTSLTSKTIGSTFISTMDEMARASQNAGATTAEAFEKISSTTSFKVKQLQGVVSAGFTDIGLSIANNLGPVVDVASSRLDLLFKVSKKGVDTFIRALKGSSKGIDFGKVIDSAIVLVIKGFKQLIKISGLVAKGILSIVEAGNVWLSQGSDFSIMDKIFGGIGVAIANISFKIAEANQAMNNFWGQNEEQAETGKQKVNDARDEFVKLYDQLNKPATLSIEAQETQDKIALIKESITSISDAAEVTLDDVAKEFTKLSEKPIVVQVKVEGLDQGTFGPIAVEPANAPAQPDFTQSFGSEFDIAKDTKKKAVESDLGPQIKNLTAAQKQIMKDEAAAQAKLDDETAKTASKVGSILVSGADGAKELLKTGAVAAATAAFGPAGAAAGPIVDALLQGPDSVKAMVEEFATALPVLIDALVEAAPVLITALADNADKIILALADPQLWLKVTFAVGQALVLAMPKVINALLAGVEQMLGQVSEAFLNIGKVFGAGVKIATDWIIQGWIKIREKAKEIFTSIWDNIKGVVDTILAPFKAIGDAFEKVVTKVKDFLSGGDTGKSIKKGADKVGGFFSDVGSAIGLADGGEVPQGFPNDTFPASLSSGENVVDRSTNQKLNSFLDGQGGSMEVLLSQILGALQGGQQVNATIEMDGERLADAILNLNRQNARLA